MKNEIKVDTDILNLKLDTMKKAFGKSAKDMLVFAAIKGAENSAKFTPPQNKDNWSRTINKDDYFRNCYYINTLLKNKMYKQYEDLFIEKLRNGYRWAVFKIKQKKKILKIWFFKSKKECKKYLKITNRGLMKAMHGLALVNQGMKSTMFNSLMKKSPNLRNLTSLNTLEFHSSNDEFTLINNNKTIDNPSLAKFTIENSLYPIKRAITQKVKQWQDDYFASGEIPF